MYSRFDEAFMMQVILAELYVVWGSWGHFENSYFAISSCLQRATAEAGYREDAINLPFIFWHLKLALHGIANWEAQTRFQS